MNTFKRLARALDNNTPLVDALRKIKDVVFGNTSIEGTLDVTGNSTYGGHVDLGDNDYLRIGNGLDLQILHNASDSFITNHTGNLNLRNINPSGTTTLANDDSGSTLKNTSGMITSTTMTTICSTVEIRSVNKRRARSCS